jgi:hypothetical protein
MCIGDVGRLIAKKWSSTEGRKALETIQASVRGFSHEAGQCFLFLHCPTSLAERRCETVVELQEVRMGKASALITFVGCQEKKGQVSDSSETVCTAGEMDHYVLLSGNVMCAPAIIARI